MIDLKSVNILPESFFSFYLHYIRSRDKLVQAVAERLRFPVSEHVELLGLACTIVVQSGVIPLGELVSSHGAGLA